MAYPSSFETLVEKFASLPGIGTKSAQRLAFHIISLSQQEADDFASAISIARHAVCRCGVCQNLTDTKVCQVCSDKGRDHSTVCVVADPRDVAAIERSREYRGVYHVLHGVISPINRVGPDDLTIRELIERVSGGEVTEVILATNPDTEGETTARYLSRLIRPFGIKVTRLAYGIPVGGNLEFADDATLMRALDGRREF